MARLIDADELTISTAVPLDGKPYQYVHIDNIKAAPTVDAVPVCRCKECKHGSKEILGMMYCNLYSIARCAEWFCADGERKGGADDAAD